MEPTLQFDQANLSIWYRPVKTTDDDPQHEIAQSTLLGDHAGAIARVRAIGAESTRVRCAHLLSAVCHEQRHFVDILLTNYGQSVIRRFTSLLVNVPAAMQGVESNGRLGLPLTVYGDALKRRILGLNEHPLLGRIANDVRGRGKMLKDDEVEHAIPGGVMSVGGRAQLEALAFMTQIHLLQTEFGLDMSVAVQNDMPDRRHVRNQYAWAAILGAAIGLTPAGKAPEGAFVALSPPVCALIYGMLMIRRWGQQQTEIKGGNSASAAARVDPLVGHLQSTGTLKRASSTAEAWHAVDQACAEVFGRSAHEELQYDLEYEARYCDSVSEETGGEDSSIVQFLRGTHAARLRLAKLLDDEPEMILDPDRCRTLLAVIHPVPIFANQAGEDDDVPDGWAALWGSGSELGALGRVTWSWAKAPVGAIASGARIHIVRNVESWLAVVKDWMPLVKLLLHGRRQSAVLRPELFHAENFLKGVGLEPAFDPLYATAPVDTSSDAFWRLTGMTSAVCDACDAPIARGGGHDVPGVFFRQTDHAAKWLVEKLSGGQSQEFGLYFARKDWTGWLLCDTCHAEVMPLGNVGGAA